MDDHVTRNVPATDEQLACQAQTGCRSSFEVLVRRYQTRLLRFLECRCGRRELAEDALQEAFLTAFRRLNTYDSKWRFSTWLFTIAKRIETRLRTRQICQPIDAHEIEGIDYRQPQDDLSSRESRRTLWKLVADCTSPDEFTALWLAYVEAMRTDEIAQIVGRTLAATKMMLVRARKKVKQSLQVNGDRNDDLGDAVAINKGRIAG